MKQSEYLKEFIFDKRHRSSTSWIFAVLGVVTPNFLYILASFNYSQMRVSNALFLGLIVMLGIYINRYLFIIILTPLMLLDLSSFIADYFQLPISMLFDSIKYANSLNIFFSLTYLALTFTFVFSIIGTYHVVRYARNNRKHFSAFPFFFVLFAYSSFELMINAPAHHLQSFKSQLAGTFTPINGAATTHANLKEKIGSPVKSNILIVIVEGLGAFLDAEKQSIIWAPLLDNRITSLFEIQSGASPYFGSTSSAEARELCHLRADYRDFRDKKDVDCLPQFARAAGYQTASFHGFKGTFFERFDWYPKIGFEQLNFLENQAGHAEQEKLPSCGLTFEGLCDTDVAASVKTYLLKKDNKPKFAYWLTLNSHKPVAPGEVPERLNCRDGGVFGDVELCRMAEQWLHISYLVKDIALNPKLESTEIVLVGDHHPPLFTRKGRNQFEPGKVAWLHLKPRNREPESVAAHPVSDEQKIASASSGTSTDIR